MSLTPSGLLYFLLFVLLYEFDSLTSPFLSGCKSYNHLHCGYHSHAHILSSIGCLYPVAVLGWQLHKHDYPQCLFEFDLWMGWFLKCSGCFPSSVCLMDGSILSLLHLLGMFSLLNGDLPVVFINHLCTVFAKSWFSCLGSPTWCCTWFIYHILLCQL